jgi:hypothetical protein
MIVIRDEPPKKSEQSGWALAGKILLWIIFGPLIFFIWVIFDFVIDGAFCGNVSSKYKSSNGGSGGDGGHD